MIISDWSSDVCSSDLVALEKADDGKQYPDDADIAVLVERLAEGGDDGDEIEPGGEAGGKSGDGDDQQRVEPKQEADDDDKNSGKDEKVVHGAPQPPPPGVSITNISRSEEHTSEFQSLMR